MARLLFVDDEANVLSALRRQFEREHEVETFTSPHQALQRARDVKFDLVMADYQMPEMDGIAFLEVFAQHQPDAMRLILSGRVDVDTLIKSINISHVCRFVPKPWNEFELKSLVAQALNYGQAMLENRSLAAAYLDRHGKTPGAPGHGIYRILLVSAEVDDVASMMHELTFLPSGEDRQVLRANRMHGCASYGGKDFRSVVDVASTRQQALEQMARNVYDLVVLDLPLPGEGVPDFIAEMHRLGPESACILVDGSPDMEAIEAVINRMPIDDFVKRPWIAHELKAVALRALRYRELRLENRRLANLFRQEKNIAGRPE